MTYQVVYRIIAYICEGGVVYDKREDGACAFSRVFRLNPDGCRWAVVGVGDEFHVYDMHNALMGERGDVFFPGKHHVFPTEDAAMTAALMLPATDS